MTDKSNYSEWSDQLKGIVRHRPDKKGCQTGEKPLCGTNSQNATQNTLNTERHVSAQESRTLLQRFARYENEYDRAEKARQEENGVDRHDTVNHPAHYAQGNHDAVNHPTHYCQGGVECLDAIQSAVTGLSGPEAVCAGNVIKYVWRYKRKNGTEDLRKARFYLDRLISIVGKGDA